MCRKVDLGYFKDFVWAGPVRWKLRNSDFYDFYVILACHVVFADQNEKFVVND